MPPFGNDLDFGSAGAMLIPDSELANWNYLAVSGDKEAGLWFVDRTNPGGHLTSCDGNCTCTTTNTNIVQMFSTGNHLIHTSPAFWENDVVTHPAQNYIYVAPYGSQLTQYPLCGLATDAQPICSRSVPRGSVDGNGHAVKFPWGVTPTISASGTETVPDAIVWALSVGDTQNPSNPLSQVPGILYAFDAMTMQELYSSNNPCTNDAINPATKFSVPTVANGYVYVGTESDNVNTIGKGTFYVFGPGRTGC